MRASFEDAWSRYTPISATPSVTPSQTSIHAGLRCDGKDFAESETSRVNPSIHVGCDGVTDRNPETGVSEVDEVELERLADLARETQESTS